MVAGSWRDGMNLVDLLEKLSASMNSPFSVHWTKYSARCLLFFTLGYAVVALAATANRKHYRRGAGSTVPPGGATCAGSPSGTGTRKILNKTSF